MFYFHEYYIQVKVFLEKQKSVTSGNFSVCFGYFFVHFWYFLIHLNHFPTAILCYFVALNK